MNKIWDAYKKSMETHWSDEELYLYGIRQLKMTLLNLATIIVIGFLFGMVMEGLVFALCYVLLRKVSGGFHAGSNISCYLLSVLFYTLSLFIVKMTEPSFIIELWGIILFVILISFMPVENENKRLSETEKKTFQRFAVFLYPVLFCISYVLLRLHVDSFYKTIEVAIIGTEILCMIKLLMDAGKTRKEKFHKKEDNARESIL